MNSFLLLGLCCAFWFLTVGLVVDTEVKCIRVGNFSEAQPGGRFPKGWEPLPFRGIKKTQYELVKKSETVVVKAVSEQAASGLVRRVNIDPQQYPIVEWRWRVENLLPREDLSKKSGDDYAARFYITFGGDPDEVRFWERLPLLRAFSNKVPLKALNYLWASSAAVGTIVPNPFTAAVMMVVVESGEERLQTWVTHRRNVYDDYKAAFNEEVPLITGVALMTDSDNTGGAVMAYYGDIVFRKENQQIQRGETEG